MRLGISTFSRKYFTKAFRKGKRIEEREREDQFSAKDMDSPKERERERKKERKKRRKRHQGWRAIHLVDWP
jgi:hypothetical protein